MKVKKTEYYGFDHEKVNKKFTGGLTFCNEFCVKGEYHPVAVYKVANPDRAKGHKSYLLLNGPPHNCVRGMDEQEIKKWRFQQGVHCLECDTVLFSTNRHHMESCECPNGTFVDGGSDYMRMGALDFSKTRQVMIDLITDEVIPIATDNDPEVPNED